LCAGPPFSVISNLEFVIIPVFFNLNE
jgi:hypothetical protein